jgi:Cu2+-containing amine oxidase
MWTNYDVNSPIIQSVCYSDKSLAQLGLSYYIKEFNDQVIEINRNKKQVTSVNGTVIKYDYMVIAPNRKYEYGGEALTGIFNANRSEVAALRTYLSSVKNDGKIVM